MEWLARRAPSWGPPIVIDGLHRKQRGEWTMDRLRHRLLAGLAGSLAALPWISGTTAGAAVHPTSVWTQWGQNAQHQGVTAAEGQPLQTALSDYVYDPFVTQEQTDFGGDLNVHYQVPLV